MADRAHAPALHVPPGPQLVPHDPQFAGSFAVSTQESPQLVVPPGHGSEHDDMMQSCSPGHAWPQAPQFAGSFIVSTHLPLHTVCVPGTQWSRGMTPPGVVHPLGLMQHVSAPLQNLPSSQFESILHCTHSARVSLQ